MHVVHVIWHLAVGGGEVFLRDLALELHARGVGQDVFTVGPAGQVAAELAAERIPVHTFDKSSRIGLGVIIQMTRALVRLRPSVVHTHGEAGLLWGLPAARFAGVPAAALMYLNYDETNLKMMAYRAALRRASMVVAGSASVGTFLSDRLGVRADRMRVVPCGIRTGGLQSAPRFPHQEVVLISVGRLVPRKGHRVLIDAFADIQTLVPECRLTIVGDGPERGDLERHASDRGLTDRIHFAGTVYPTTGALASADVFVFPSLVEPQGLAVLEAVACGLPVIASRTGGIVEMLSDDEALLVPPGDANALGAAIVRMTRDAALRARCVERARRRLASFEIGAIADRYLDIYRDAMAHRHASG